MRRFCFLSCFLASVLTLISCASSKQAESERRISAMPELIESNPPQRPVWADSIPQSDETLYFVGLSNGIATEKEARNDAYQNVLSQVVKYYGEIIKIQSNETKSVKALSSDVIDPYIESEEMIQRYAQAYVHEILPENYYTEHWLVDGEDEWKCWVKCSVSKQKIQKEIESFAANISERYSSLLPENQKGKYSSTKSAVEAYLSVYRTVHENPIYQAVAYVQTASGKASLDDYALLQAKRVIQNINIEKIDYTDYVEQGSDFKATVRLASPDYEKITGMSARISLTRGGKNIAVIEREPDDKNNIELLIYSDKLQYGDYAVVIELFTNEYRDLGEIHTSSSNVVFKFGYIKAPVKVEYAKDKSAELLSDLGSEVDSKMKNILQEKISENVLPVEIADESFSDSKFVVQIKSTELKAAEGVHKVKVSATVLFQRNGVTLAKSSEVSGIGLSKIGSAMAAQSAFEQICGFLEKEETFYKNILNAVGGKR